MAHIICAAGGRAITGKTGNVLDIVPQDIHGRGPIILGSKADVDAFEACYKATA